MPTDDEISAEARQVLDATMRRLEDQGALIDARNHPPVSIEEVYPTPMATDENGDWVTPDREMWVYRFQRDGCGDRAQS